MTNDEARSGPAGARRRTAVPDAEVSTDTRQASVDKAGASTRRAFIQGAGAAAAVAAVAVPAQADAETSHRRRARLPLAAERLRVDGVSNPIGIGNPEPTFSWSLAGDGRNRLQTGYQVRVASSRSRLLQGAADLWDSGKVRSGAVSVSYAGRSLASRMQCWWQVRVWDERQHASLWSTPACFEVGLLAPSDWTAEWIGNPDWDASSEPLGPATIKLAAQTAQYFQLSVTELGAGLIEGWPYPVSRLQLAEIQILDSSNPTVDLALGKSVTATDTYAVPGQWEPQYLTDGKTSGDTAPFGYTSLQHEDPDVSSDPILITIDLGAPVTFDTVKLWPRTGQLTADGTTPNFPVDFTIDVSDHADGPFTTAATITNQQAPEPTSTPAATPLFTGRFTLRKRPQSARLYISGLGVYVPTVNGSPAGNTVLEPGNTAYDTRVIYQTLDVTRLLRRGANAIGIAVGTGIYDTLTYDTRYEKFSARIGPPKVIAQLEVTYADGSRDRFVTDRTWKTALGPTTFTNWYGGESFDARRVIDGWDQPGKLPSSWTTVSSSSAPSTTTVLSARFGPGIQLNELFPAEHLIVPAHGTYVFDFGTNVAGRQSIHMRAPAGTQITMRPAELINPDGTIDYGSTGNPIYDTYTFSGKGLETWSPTYAYHGMRYLQVEGLPSKPSKNAVCARVLHTANEPAGQFECSHQLISDIHRIINRSVLANMQSILTDCPTREKLGWMEQDHLVFDAVARNYDISAYGRDVVRTIGDAQLSTGMVPDIAPEYVVFSDGFRDDPNWGSSIVLMPWKMYQTYGQPEILASAYDQMVAYVAYLRTRASGNLLDYGLGDWASYNASTPVGLVATYGYAKAVSGLSQVAAVLGKKSDAAEYAALLGAIRSAFHTEYYVPAQATYATGSLASDALALDMGAVPTALQKGVVKHLLGTLESNAYHLDIGEVGLPALFDVLSAYGQNQAVYRIAVKTTVPSYGAMIEAGATSLWENWDGSGSHNHFMLGAIERWFYSSLAGIDQQPSSAGYRDLLIAPAIVGGIGSVQASYRTPRGVVATTWRRRGSAVSLAVTVPPGARATVRLPGMAETVVGSGRYTFKGHLGRHSEAV